MLGAGDWGSGFRRFKDIPPTPLPQLFDAFPPPVSPVAACLHSSASTPETLTNKYPWRDLACPLHADQRGVLDPSQILGAGRSSRDGGISEILPQRRFGSQVVAPLVRLLGLRVADVEQVELAVEKLQMGFDIHMSFIGGRQFSGGPPRPPRASQQNRHRRRTPASSPHL